MCNTRRLSVALAFLGAVAFFSTTANAAVQLEVDSGSGFVTVASNPVSSTYITYVGNQGVFCISGTGGLSNSPGSQPASYVTNSTIQVCNTSNATATVAFRFSAQDFVFPGLSPPLATLTSSINGIVIVQGAAGTTLTYETWVNNNNVLSAQSPGITSGALGPMNLDAVPSSQTFPGINQTVVGGITASPFSMTTLVTLTMAAGEKIEFNANAAVAPVPEPASLALWSILGLTTAAGAAARRRRRKSQRRWSDDARNEILSIIER